MLPVIFGCQGLELTKEEIDFFCACQPMGFILFKRNCDNPLQLKKLVAQLKNIDTSRKIEILIDQEGGRVQRLGPPHWPAFPSALSFYNKSPNPKVDVYKNALSMGSMLYDLGITVNCAPCADLLLPDADIVIGDRAFANDPQIVAELAIEMLQGLYDSGITPVVKHMPGHGRAKVDSHFALPIVKESYAVLQNSDFLTFKIICEYIKKNEINSWGMTAHIVFESIDMDNPATQSGKLIDNLIRKEWGFKGLLLSDCLTMKALKGDYHTRAINALKAGCDAVLMCQGEISDFKNLLKLDY